MAYGKRFGIILFTILIIAALINSFYVTPLQISDSDFSTYIVVPMLMLPLFAIFMLKEGIIPEVRRRDALIGIALFAIFGLLTLWLSISLSFLYLSFRIDMLLFPLLIASLAILIFGLRNIGKFKAIMTYALFASPSLLIWLSSANYGFVVGNTLFIYNIIKPFFAHVSYTAPFTITANSYAVGIGQTCVGIGVLIATIMFLTPLAYLYEGKLAKKAMWVASGFGLVLLLNVLRMLGIAMAWFYYGPSNAILTIHIFAGVLLFYISIIVMILISGKYGLRFPSKKRTATTRGMQRSRHKGYYGWGVALAMLFTFIYFLMTVNYRSAQVISPITLYNRVGFNVGSVAPLFRTSNMSGFTQAEIQDTLHNEIILQITNATFNSTAPIGIILISPNQTETSELLRNATVLGKLIFINNAGSTATVYDLGADGKSLILYNELIPYILPGGQSTVASLYAVLPANRTSTAISCEGEYDVPYTWLANLPNPGGYNSTADGKMTSAYCIVNGLIS